MSITKATDTELQIAIEYNALAHNYGVAMVQIKILSDALKWYADESKFTRGSANSMSGACCAITEDGSKRARQALKDAGIE